MIIYPVIHYLEDGLALEQADIVFKNNADGVFLISHNGRDDLLSNIACKIKNKYPIKKVGINFLTKDSVNAFDIVKNLSLDMMWSDYCGIDSNKITQEGVVLSERVRQNNIEVFASVAFKYQKEEVNPAQAALNVCEKGMIATTSGLATGVAPDIDKIKSMSLKTNGLLAIASGIDKENVKNFKPYVSHILISSSLSKNNVEFDANKVKEFFDTVSVLS